MKNYRTENEKIMNRYLVKQDCYSKSKLIGRFTWWDILSSFCRNFL